MPLHQKQHSDSFVSLQHNKINGYQYQNWR
jgi:hypothetical protein